MLVTQASQARFMDRKLPYESLQKHLAQEQNISALTHWDLVTSHGAMCLVQFYLR